MNKEQFIIAIDFDKTIVNSQYPDIVGIIEGGREVINKWYLRGAYIIVWSCRTSRAQLTAEKLLLEEGFYFHKFNAQHPDPLLIFGTDNEIDHHLEGRKIFSHVLIDDTSIDWMARGSHPGWDVLDKQLEQIIKNNPDKWNIELV